MGSFDDCVFLTPLTGGEPTRLYTGQPFVAQKGGVWTANGLLFSPTPTSGLVLISDTGAPPQTVTVPDASRGEVSHRYPDILPGGRQVLITIKKEGILSFDDAEIGLLDLQTRQWKTILRGGSFARYVPTGHIIFARNGSIMGAPFDLARGEVTGAPVAVVPGVITSPGAGVAQFAVSRDPGGPGTLAYMPGGADDARGELVWLRPDGSVEPVGAPVMNYAANARVSPDGTRIAATVMGAFDAVFIYDLNRGTISRLSGRGNCALAAWTPDGSKVAYVSDAEAQPTIYVTNPDGSGTPERVPSLQMSSLHVWGAAIDGVEGIVTVNEGDIWFVPFREAPGTPSRRKLVGSPLDEAHPRVSPDGKWLSYTSNESGQYEIYVTPFPGVDSRWQVSIGGGLFHCWMPGGDGIMYIRDSDRAVLRTSFKPGPPVTVGRPEFMFTMPSDIPMGFDVHPDGARFLAVRNLQPRFAVAQVNVVLNWFEELKTKVPTTSR